VGALGNPPASQDILQSAVQQSKSESVVDGGLNLHILSEQPHDTILAHNESLKNHFEDKHSEVIDIILNRNGFQKYRLLLKDCYGLCDVVSIDYTTTMGKLALCSNKHQQASLISGSDHLLLCNTN
jgi:hypothetical protein